MPPQSDVSMVAQCRHTRRGCFPRQGSGLVKQRGTPNFSAIIELPEYCGNIPLAALRRHVPGFHHHLRESGDRRISPMECIRPYFDNFGDEPIFASAMNWIFLHVREYRSHQCQFHQIVIPFDENPFALLVIELEDAYQAGDVLAAERCLWITLSIFRALSSLLRQERFGFSLQLFDAYFDTALQLAPLISSFGFGGGPLYDLVCAVSEASGDNPDVVRRLVRQFGLPQREDLRDFCFDIARMGDILGYDILLLMAGGI